MHKSKNQQIDTSFNFQILDREKDSRRGKQAGEKLDILKTFCTNFKPHMSSIISPINKAIIFEGS